MKITNLQNLLKAKLLLCFAICSCTFYSAFGLNCSSAFDSLNTKLTYTSSPGDSGCNILCTADAVVHPGWHVLKYVWMLTPYPPVITYPPVNTHSFSIPFGATDPISVLIYATDSFGDTCTLLRTILATCDQHCMDSTGFYGIYLGPGFSHTCLFQCTAIGIPGPGYHIVEYLWQEGPVYIPIYTSATFNVQNISVHPLISELVFVTIYAVDSANDTCLEKLELALTCEDSTGWVSHRKAAPELTVENSSENISDNINVYPNPTENKVNITSESNEITSVLVIDITGKKVGNYSFEHTKSIDISLADLIPGTYLLRINNAVSKVVVKTK